MGDHFVLLVNRLLTESTLEAAIESINQLKQDDEEIKPVEVMVDCSSDGVYSSSKIVECRICQDDDLDSKMEIPCSCRGSLKYAHRKCVQKWCNEKRDTICEICRQPFKPGYTAPPPMFQFGPISMNLRRNWENTQRDLNNQRLITMVSTDRNFLNHDSDEYLVSPRKWWCCCRSVTILLMVVLIFRDAIPFILGETEHYSLRLFMLFLLRILGIVLPVYIITRAVKAMQCARRRHRESTETTDSSSDEDEEEDELNDIIYIA